MLSITIVRKCNNLEQSGQLVNIHISEKDWLFTLYSKIYSYTINSGSKYDSLIHTFGPSEIFDVSTNFLEFGLLNLMTTHNSIPAQIIGPVYSQLLMKTTALIYQNTACQATQLVNRIIQNVFRTKVSVEGIMPL